MTIGDKIKEKRKERGMSMETLAKIVGLASRDSINKYEAGIIYPSIGTLKKIAEALNVDLEINLKNKNS